MEYFNLVLTWAVAHPEISGALLLATIELVSRKVPGTITFLHALSKVLDMIPGLKNRP